MTQICRRVFVSLFGGVNASGGLHQYFDGKGAVKYVDEQDKIMN